MFALENPEAATILDEIGKLYLNKNFSDVTFVVGGEKLPAHRTILGQRCPVFKSMFLKPHVPGTLETISMNETPLDAFMVFLKFVYTGVVQFNAREINFVFETLQLAKTFEMMKLEQICVDHLKTVCTINNVTDIVNEAIKKSDDNLVKHCLGYISTNSADFIKSGSFSKLSMKVLELVFQEKTLETSNKVIFSGFVGWMKANPLESAQFPKLLKYIKLNVIPLDDLVTVVRPLKLIDDKSTTLKHSISKADDSILIDLRHLFILNSLRIKLTDGDWGYRIEVSQDNVSWTRIVDYSNYVCRSVQRLYFKARPVRYIRICGTAPADGTFEIVQFEAYCKENPLEVDPETGIVIPTDNVALYLKNAVIIKGTDSFGYFNALINGNPMAGHTYHQIGRDSIIVQLPQPYLLDSMKLCLTNVCSYNIEVSTDKVHWTQIFEEKNVTSWRQVKFSKQPVAFIKITGTEGSHSSPYTFGCTLLECPATN